MHFIQYISECFRLKFVANILKWETKRRRWLNRKLDASTQVGVRYCSCIISITWERSFWANEMRKNKQVTFQKLYESYLEKTKGFCHIFTFGPHSWLTPGLGAPNKKDIWRWYSLGWIAGKNNNRFMLNLYESVTGYFSQRSTTKYSISRTFGCLKKIQEDINIFYLFSKRSTIKYSISSNVR